MAKKEIALDLCPVMAKYRELIKSLGPGLLYAGAAIGVSHLVQSTRAGAEYGYILITAVILANILKYPFFEAGPRFASVTGKSLLNGYRWIGEWAVMLFLFLTITTMFIFQAAVTIVTAGLAQYITGITWDLWVWSAFLLAICAIILWVGRYAILDNLMKVIIVTLAITTVVAVANGSLGEFEKSPEFMRSFSFLNNKDIFFLIALVGWMPAPIDIAVWHSVWTVAKKRSSDKSHGLKEAIFDFKIGYWGTAFLAVCFVMLGAMVMFGSGESLPGTGGAFAGKLIEMYTQSLGAWAYPLIAVAAFTTMFSTTLTLLDAFPRVLRPTFKILIPKARFSRRNSSLYNGILLVLLVGTILVLAYFQENMRGLVDLATTISFLTAPVLAWLNMRSLNHKNFPEEHRPTRKVRQLSYVGMVFLIAFSAYFIYLKL